MRKAATYIIIGPFALIIIVTAIILLFPAIANSGILLGCTFGMGLAITASITRYIARTGRTERKLLARARSSLAAHIQAHWSALSVEMSRSVETDPFGKILRDKRKAVAAYFLKSTAFDYSPLTRDEAISMILESFPTGPS